MHFKRWYFCEVFYRTGQVLQILGLFEEGSWLGITAINVWIETAFGDSGIDRDCGIMARDFWRLGGC